jgi:peptidoglycan/LPS O-acetylase OafA/YrhL
MGAMIGISVWLARIGQPLSVRSLIPPAFTLAVFAAIPILFRQTRAFNADRLIGELSYPVYISHILIIWLVGQGNYHTGKAGFLLVSALTIALSYALYRWIDVPIDTYRHRKLSPLLVEGKHQAPSGIHTAPVSGA